MRVVFMGTPAFAVPSLDALSRSHEVVAVYTRPDAPAGRGRVLTASAVAARAAALSLPLRKHATLRDDAVIAELARFQPDVIAVAAYGLILPWAVLEIPVDAPVNVHASLLPRWRGAAPVQRAILAGDDVTGVSIMRMAEGLDTGPWCVQRSVAVDDHTTDSLTTVLAQAGADALLEALAAIESGSVVWNDQDDALATYAAKITRDDVALAPELAVADAWRRIRASSSQAPAGACVDGRMLTVIDAAEPSATVAPGRVAVARDAVTLGFGDGALDVHTIVPAGRGAMDAAAWARGARLQADAPWGSCE
jgi:methionyl-tRNA formyltransferase